MKILFKLIIPILVLALGVWGMLALKSLRKPPPKRKIPERIVSMNVVKASYAPVTPEISILARVRARDRVNFAAEINGKIMQEGFKLRKGMRFSKGSILLKIDDEAVDNTLKVRISNLMSGVGDMLPDMKIDLPDSWQRWHTFFNQISFDHLPSLPQYQSDKEKMYLARFNIFTLYYNTRNQQQIVDKYTIRAPFTGLVAESRVHPGDLANPGAPLAMLVSTEKYELELPVTQKQLAYMQKGMKVQVTIAENGYKTHGTIVRLSPVLDDISQTAIAIVEVPGSKDVVDGAYAEMLINGKELTRAFIVPRQALYQDNYALVIGGVKPSKRNMVQANLALKPQTDKKKRPELGKKPSARNPNLVGAMEIRPVTIAFLGEKYAYITEGIREGEFVVIEPTQNVAPEMKVRPIIKPDTN